MKKMSFTKKTMIALIAGLLVGVGVILLREQLTASGNENIWQTINNILFADITAEGNNQAIGIFYIIGQLFIRALQLVLIPLIFTSIVKAIQHIHDTSMLNKLAKKTFVNFIILSGLALALGTLVGFTAYQLGIFHFTAPSDLTTVSDATTGGNPLNVILNLIQPNLVATFTNNGSILAVVVLAILIGIGIQTLGDKVSILPKLNNEVHDLSMKFLNFVITKVGPIAIFTLLVRTFASYGIQYLQPAIVYMVLTIAALFVFALIIMPLVLLFIPKLSPIPYLKKIYKVAVFGFSTSSSAATLPLNMETTTNDLGVDESLVSFVTPLATTLNMTGTAIMQVIATFFIASVAGYSVGGIEVAAIIALAFVGSISTPAAPGAGAILLFTIISGLGFTNPAALAAYTFILAINRPVEMLVTAVNVLDDSVSALCIGKSMNMLNEQVYNNMEKDLQEENLSVATVIDAVE